jgi:hypothetical protein
LFRFVLSLTFFDFLKSGAEEGQQGTASLFQARQVRWWQAKEEGTDFDLEEEYFVLLVFD